VVSIADACRGDQWARVDDEHDLPPDAPRDDPSDVFIDHRAALSDREERQRPAGFRRGQVELNRLAQRRDPERHLRAHGARPLREGGNHSF
jgi:hypothetical protein